MTSLRVTRSGSSRSHCPERETPVPHGIEIELNSRQTAAVFGRLYRDGGIMADSRDYVMQVDAVGDDFRLYPISNCGKGQPMQTKKLGNGGPTMRSRAILTGGR